MPGYESTTRRMPDEHPGLCALVQDVLPFYIEGEASAESRAFIDKHLAECARCDSFLAGARSVQAHLRRETDVRTRTFTDDHHAREMIARGRQKVIGFALAAAGAVALLAVLCLAAAGFARSQGVTSAPAPTVAPPVAVPNSLLAPVVTPAAPTAEVIPTPTPFGLTPTVVPTSLPTPRASVP